MSGGEDTIPPMDPERVPVRISVTGAVAIAVLGVLLTGAVTVGIYQNRIATLEKSDDAQNILVIAHDRQIAEMRATNNAIFQRLDSIDRKLEAQQR